MEMINCNQNLILLSYNIIFYPKLLNLKRTKKIEPKKSIYNECTSQSYFESVNIYIVLTINLDGSYILLIYVRGKMYI